jgi:prepilin-type N-terminal cleavage/methylation domain-containing protein
MEEEAGFSLVELLIVVAIIAIIATIAVPSLLTSRKATNEAAAVQGCRNIGTAQIVYASANSRKFTTLATLVSGNYLDSRFSSASGFNGYSYASGTVANAPGAGAPPTSFEFVATPNAGGGRYHYGIGPDQVVRYLAAVSGNTAPLGLSAGDPIGKN